MGMINYVRLDDPTVEWGEPVFFGPYDYIRVSGNHIYLENYTGEPADVLYITVASGRIFYDGVWYGDAVIFALSEDTNISLFEWSKLHQNFDKKKTFHPHAVNIPPDLYERAAAYIKEGKYITAVREIKITMHCTILEAKQTVDKMCEEFEIKRN
jgi:hypothetical protein